MKEKAKFVFWRYLIGFFVLACGAGMLMEKQYIPGVFCFVIGLIAFVWSPNCLDDK